MKNHSLTAIGILLTVFILASCEESEIPSYKAVEGTYAGTLTYYDGTKSPGHTGTKENATAKITKIGNDLLEVHCYNDEVDTTFMLNYYEHNQEVLVCFTGDDFENMYSHELGQGHMNGGMMNDMGNGETEWMHHLNDEHEEDDEHYGGFNMQDHSFEYRFNIMKEGLPYSVEFHGKK